MTGKEQEPAESDSLRIGRARLRAKEQNANSWFKQQLAEQFRGVHREQVEQPPIRLPIEAIKAQTVDENLLAYVASEFAYRDYSNKTGTPQERAQRETAAGSPASPEGEVYDDLIGHPFPQVAQATERPDGHEYEEAFKDLDAARAAFLLLSVSKYRFTQHDLYTHLGDIRVLPAKIEVTPRQAKLVELLANRAGLPYDASQTSITTGLDFAPSAVAGRSRPPAR
ncbi:hypothetical protein [Streptomyces cirratus]|uniref:hypothetical protein n=1 Tax=Streptomyces cirratus TaxID=68187 RepID=UPI00167CBF05|nr:hypothetical protein [Streptomyces cirratus]